MQHAIGLRLDFEAGAAYVAYRRVPEGARIDHVTRLSDDVVVQFDGTGEVLGIELIEVTGAAVEVGSGFAEQNGLAFPSLRDFVRDETAELGPLGLAVQDDEAGQVTDEGLDRRKIG